MREGGGGRRRGRGRRRGEKELLGVGNISKAIFSMPEHSSMTFFFFLRGRE